MNDKSYHSFLTVTSPEVIFFQAPFRYPRQILAAVSVTSSMSPFIIWKRKCNLKLEPKQGMILMTMSLNYCPGFFHIPIREDKNICFVLI